VTVADSDVLRKRRERAHRAGDHSLCRPEWCPDAPEPDLGEVGELEAAVAGFVDGLDLDERDPRVLTGLVAVRLARSLDGRTSAAVAKELRACLDRLTPDLDFEEDDSQAAELLRGLNGILR
jgi:hypothetical protein